MQKIVNIGVVFATHYKHLYRDLIAALKMENSCRQIFVYVADDTQKQYVNENFDLNLISKVLFYPRFANDFDEFASLSENEKRRSIRLFEEKNRVSANSLLVVDRHFGRGYSPGGFYHAKSSRAVNHGYQDAVYSHINCFNFFCDEIKNRSLNLFIGGSALVIRACNASKIPYRNLVSARYQNRYAWCVDQYWSNPLVELEYNKVDDSEMPDELAIERYYESKTFRSTNLENQNSLLWLMKMLAIIVIRFVRNFFRSGRKSGQYMLAEQIKFSIRRYLGRKEMEKSKYCKTLGDCPPKFIFYPLQTEPEATLQAFSPEFFFQHTLIIMLSKATPFDIPIIVKEAFLAAGRRPKNFYEQILDLLNVSFVDINLEGVDIIKRASVVCTISGTAGIEAAMMGKPVLNFGQHNCYEFLDHSIDVRHFSGVEEGIRRALNIDLQKAKLDGLRFQVAMKKATVDMREFSSSAPEKISTDIIDDCLNLLRRSLLVTDNTE